MLLYFVIFVVIGALLCVNLFVGKLLLDVVGVLVEHLALPMQVCSLTTTIGGFLASERCQSIDFCVALG